MPPTLTSLVLMGSSTERGTERSAASWKTPSTPATARRTIVEVAQVAFDDLDTIQTGEVLAAAGREVVEHADPIAPPHQASAMFEPMKPAPPVTM